MNVSLRWYVTALIAFGSLSCSDPVPPPVQGAFIASVAGVSPPPAGKACPAGAAFTYDVPEVRATKPAEALDDDTYLHRAIDGESGADLSCSVKGGSAGYTFSGKIARSGQSLQVLSGTLGADGKGTAQIIVANSRSLSAALISPSANCVITTSDVQPGSMWAHFTCPSVEAPPSDSCKAEGTFVFENCSK